MAALKVRHCLLPFALLTASFALFAHRLDEYLQATLVAIESHGIRLQLSLEPGVAIAEQVLAHIDRDHNQAISSHEATAYAEALQRDLTLRIDGRPAPMTLLHSTFPTPTELRSGSGIIQLEFSATFGALATGAHRLSFENRHLGEISVYLFNAVQPASSEIQITRQQRNSNQSVGEIEFALRK